MDLSLPQFPDSHLLTHSQMQTKKTCARKHLFSYLLGWRPKGTSRALRIGSIVHEGLDMWASGEMPADVLAWADLQEYEDDYERAVVVNLIHGYFQRWGDSELKTVASEIQFEVPIRNPDSGRVSRSYKAAGKIDRIVRKPSLHLALLETKTVSESIEPTSDYWNRLEIDQQITLYMLVARKLGYDVRTVIYDVIRKPTIRPKQIPQLDSQGRKIVQDQTGQRSLNKNGTPKQSASNPDGEEMLMRLETADEFGHRLAKDIASRPDFYYARRDIPRLEADLEEFENELWWQQKDISAAIRFGYHPRNTGACDWKGKCPYLPICRNAVVPDEVPSGFVRVDRVHQELELKDED